MRTFAAIVASGALHLGLSWWLAREAPAPRSREARGAVEVDFVAARTRGGEPAAPGPRAEPPSRSRGIRSHRFAAAVRTPGASAGQSVAVGPGPGSVPAAEPSLAAPAAPDGEPEPGGSRIAGELSRWTREEIARSSPFTQRPPPELHPMADGGYRWDGRLFSARIDPEGMLHFSDHDVGLEFRDRSPTVTFDLNDWIQRAAGNDPFGAERRWFAEQTRDLRERLAARARSHSAARSLAALDARLEGIVARLSHDPAGSRELLFDLWDECSNDSAGDSARRRIEAFIRERLPPTGTAAYTADDLARLNARRSSSRRFDPYASSP